MARPRAGVDAPEGRSAYAAGAVVAISQPLSFGLQLGTTVLLARLLTPSDFGLVAMVTAVSNFGLMFRDMGLGTITVQRPSLSSDQIANLFWINALGGAVVAAILCGAAWPLSWLYGDDRVIGITAATSSIFVVAGLSVQHAALLKRQVRFGASVTVDLVALALAGITAVAVALATRSYWAIVVFNVSRPTLTLFGLWTVNAWRPGRFRRNRGTAALVRSGFHIVGFDAVNYWSRNLDNLIIGRQLGADVLGIYAKAYELLLLPLSQLRAPITSVSLPFLSRHQLAPSQLAHKFLDLVATLAILSASLVGLMVLTADWAIPLVLGPQWAPAVAVFRWLAFAAAIQSVVGVLGTLLLATGRTRRYFAWGTWHAAAIVSSFLIGITWGLWGLIAGYVVANILLFVPSAIYCTAGTEVRASEFARRSMLPMCVAGAGLVAAFWTRRILDGEGYGLVTQNVSAIGSYSAVLATHIATSPTRYRFLMNMSAQLWSPLKMLSPSAINTAK